MTSKKEQMEAKKLTLVERLQTIQTRMHQTMIELEQIKTRTDLTDDERWCLLIEIGERYKKEIAEL